MDPARQHSRVCAITGAVLLDLTVSPLFIWDVFTEPLSQQLHLSASQLSAVFSVGLAAFSIAVLLGGRLADATAPRYLAIATGVGITTGLAITAVTQQFWALIFGFGLLQGLAAGVGYVTAVRIASTLTRNRGVGIGLVVSAYAAGSAVLAPICTQLLTETGRQGTLLMLAAALGIVALIACALVPGSSPANEDETSGVRSSPRQKMVVTSLWLTFGLGSAPALAAFALAGEFTRGSAAVAVSALSAGNLIGRLFAGPIAHTVGTSPALHGFAAIAAGACAVLMTSGSPGWLAPTALFALGAQYGALSVLTPLITASAIPANAFGATYGVVFTAWGIAGLFAPATTTWIATQSGYHAAAGALLATAFLAWMAAATLLFLLRR